MLSSVCTNSTIQSKTILIIAYCAINGGHQQSRREIAELQ